MATGDARLISFNRVLACLGLILLLGPLTARAEATFEAEALTISVDRGAREIHGTLVADSIYWHMCWGDSEAHVKIRRAQPGHDKLVNEDPYTDWDDNWKVVFHGTASKGKRIYAEVPGFDDCAPVRSRIVKAP